MGQYDCCCKILQSPSKAPLLRPMWSCIELLPMQRENRTRHLWNKRHHGPGLMATRSLWSNPIAFSLCTTQQIGIHSPQAVRRYAQGRELSKRRGALSLGGKLLPASLPGGVGQ